MAALKDGVRAHKKIKDCEDVDTFEKKQKPKLVDKCFQECKTYMHVRSGNSSMREKSSGRLSRSQTDRKKRECSGAPQMTE